MRRARAVVEDVAEVGVGGFGTDFGALHKCRAVGLLGDFALFDWLCKARPSSAGIELIQGTEQRLAGNYIDINAGLMVVPIRVLEGRFRAALLRHAVLH